MPASHFTAAVRELLEAELRCPNCGAENVPGKRGKHIELNERGVAVCNVCLKEFRPVLNEGPLDTN